MSRSRKGRWLAISLVGMLTACGEDDASILVRVEFGDLQIPEQADSLCLGLWDVDSAGGSFGQRYRLAGDVVASLAVDPGNAVQANLMARIARRGIDVNAAFSAVDFAADVVLDVARCPSGLPGAASERGGREIPTGSSVAVSHGGGGAWIVAVAEGQGQVLQAGAQGLVDVPVSSPAGQGTVLAILAVDADNDCDDDILILEEAGPRLWLRDLSGFTAANQILPQGGMPGVAGAVFDANGDLLQDVALVGPAGLELWVGGAEGFGIVPDAAAGADLTDATDIDSADLDGDGNLDLVVARAGAAGANDRVLYGDGLGGFVLDVDALPEAVTRSLVTSIADIDGDGIAEIIVAGVDEPVRAFARDQARSYADRSFLLLPSTANFNALSLSTADWNGDCEADLVIAASDTESWVSPGAMLVAEAPLPGALQVLVADLLGTGGRDLLLVEASYLRWWKR